MFLITKQISNMIIIKVHLGIATNSSRLTTNICFVLFHFKVTLVILFGFSSLFVLDDSYMCRVKEEPVLVVYYSMIVNWCMLTFTEVIHSPWLTTFPIIADQHDLMKLLRVTIHLLSRNKHWFKYTNNLYYDNLRNPQPF